jgi:acyl carrier protein
MTHDDILERITNIMKDLTEDDELVLTDETTADDVPLWDSVLHVKLIVAIEDEFKVRFEVDEITEPENVGTLVALVESKLGG